jgi:hypothetical protein
MSSFGQIDFVYEMDGTVDDDFSNFNNEMPNHSDEFVTLESHLDSAIIYRNGFDSIKYVRISDGIWDTKWIYSFKNLFYTNNKVEFIVTNYNYPSYDDSANPLTSPSALIKVINEDEEVYFESDTINGAFGIYYVDSKPHLAIINNETKTTKFYKLGGDLPDGSLSQGNAESISVEDTLNIDLVTSVGKVSQNELRVWNDNNTIRYQLDEAGDFQVLIFNTNAQLQHQEDNFTGIDGSFNASGLALGLYFITINDNDEILKSETKKIVIR